VTLEVSQCDLSCGATRVTKNMMLCRWQSFLFSSLFFLSSNWNSCCTIHNSNLSFHFITILNLILILLIINFSFGSFCNLFFTPQPSILSCPHFFFSNLVLIFLIVIFYFGSFCEIEFLFSISFFNKNLQVVLLIFFFKFGSIFVLLFFVLGPFAKITFFFNFILHH
jgi:hypothetical protein